MTNLGDQTRKQTSNSTESMAVIGEAEIALKGLDGACADGVYAIR